MEFSDQANIYLKFRPRCPEDLIDFVVSNCKNKDFVWDCGTGNGQVASALSSFFTNILATDISKNQLDHAIKKPNITYQMAPVEEVQLKPNSLDLITVSQAFHWFDHSKFIPLCLKYLVPRGILAIWSYESISIEHPIIETIRKFDLNELKPYWNNKTKRLHIDPFMTFKGFEKIETERFIIERYFDSEALIGYISTWSASNKYIKTNKDRFDQLCTKIRTELRTTSVQCRWKINLRMGAKIQA